MYEERWISSSQIEKRAEYGENLLTPFHGYPSFLLSGKGHLEGIFAMNQFKEEAVLMLEGGLKETGSVLLSGGVSEESCQLFRCCHGDTQGLGGRRKQPKHR